MRLLVVDDEPDLRKLYELTLVREGHAIDTADSVATAREALASRSYDLLITDMRLPDGSGLDLLRELEAKARSERAIVITAYGSAENAVQALKAGAYDYLTKPVDLKQLRGVVAAALGREALPAPVRAPRSGGPGPAGAARLNEWVMERTTERSTERTSDRMAGDSAAMQEVRHLIGKVSRSMAPVLIYGESGTGKELVARAVHEVGVRAAAPFMAVNCGAIPEHLLEAEFFGYRKGAFTGAAEDREGFFQAARGGTLFLDEIGDLPLAMQSKLLRAIQERAVRPVGATTEQAVDVRILSATHKDLAAAVDAGRFRQDLYYRLNVIQIRVPPLRERMADLDAICDRLLTRIGAESGHANGVRLGAAARALLHTHSFPGNVRELENMLHRAVALCNGEMILAEDLGLLQRGGQGAAEPPEPSAARPASAGVAAPAVLSAEAIGPQEAQGLVPVDLQAHLDAIEREILQRALSVHRFNRTAAGAAMGLTLRQMRYRMARLGVRAPGEGGRSGDGEGDAGGES